MKKKGSNLYLFLIILAIILIILLAIAFLYKPETTGNVARENRISSEGLIASYLFEGNSQTDNGTISDAVNWTRIEEMNSIPDPKIWKFIKEKKSKCNPSIGNGQLTISTMANDSCSYVSNNVTNFTNGFTYEARIKATITKPIAIISVVDKNTYSTLWLNSTSVCLNKNITCVGFDIYNSHTYRVTIKDQTVKLWVDNYYIGSAPTLTNSTKSNFIKFGDIDKAPNSTNTLVFDYLKYYNAYDSPMTYESGKIGQAASFDGISDYIALPKEIIDGKSQISLSIWVKVNNFTNYGSIISKSNLSARGNELGLFTLSNRTIQFELDSNSNVHIVKTPQLNTNTWYHIVGTYNGSEIRVYTNGVLSASRPRTGNLRNLNRLDLNIGANSIKTNFFNGVIDDLDIYDKALNESEVQKIYNGNCNVLISDQNYVLNQDDINSSLSESYICYNRNIYSCKEYPDEFVNIIAEDLQQVGSWQCDINTEKWVSVIPRFQRVSATCSYGSNCGPFTITSNKKGNSAYELWWDYYLNNGSVIHYCANSPENGNSCNIDIDNQNSRRVLIASTTPVLEVSQVISTESKEIVNKVVLKIASKRNNHKSKYTEREIPVTYNCTNECQYIGQVQCNGTMLYKRKICGSYNASNSCLTGGPLGDCENNKICVNSQCTETANVDTCMNAGGICLNSILTNMIQLTENCPAQDYNCYKCSTSPSRTYTWDPNFLKCIRTNCSNTCIINNGTCKNSSLENSNINSSLDCCDNGDCYFCDTNYHFYNNSCISNLCSGNPPSTAGQNGTLIGANNFTVDSAQNWTYYPNITQLFPCQWKCASGYRRVTNDTFDGCIEGFAPCETNIGCKNETINNAFVVLERNCSIGQCYQCSPGFNWTNDTCISTCPNGCIYNGLCLSQGIRIINNNNTKMYCFNTIMNLQKTEDSPCNQSYECLNNYCKSGNCTSLLNELHKTRASTEKLLCWIRKLFGSQETC